VEVLVVVVITESLLVDGPEGRIHVGVDIRISSDGVIQGQGERNRNVGAGHIVEPRVEARCAVDGFGGVGETGSEDGFTITSDIGGNETPIVVNVPFEVRVAFGRIASHSRSDFGATSVGTRNGGTRPDISYKTVQLNGVCINSNSTSQQEETNVGALHNYYRLSFRSFTFQIASFLG
jgi:hypothetical protein